MLDHYTAKPNLQNSIIGIFIDKITKVHIITQGKH